MRIRFQFADQSFTATLEDSLSARELWSMLPLDLTVEDYGGNEKIAYLQPPFAKKEASPSPARRQATSATMPPGATSRSSTPAIAGQLA